MKYAIRLLLSDAQNADDLAIWWSLKQDTGRNTTTLTTTRYAAARASIAGVPCTPMAGSVVDLLLSRGRDKKAGDKRLTPGIYHMAVATRAGRVVPCCFTCGRICSHYLSVSPILRGFTLTSSPSGLF